MLCMFVEVCLVCWDNRVSLMHVLGAVLQGNNQQIFSKVTEHAIPVVINGCLKTEKLELGRTVMIDDLSMWI